MTELETGPETGPEVEPENGPGTGGAGTRELAIPESSLVLLIGATGSGKSTFAARHFRPTEVVSSDTCRGLVSDDDNDQSATADAFDVLGYIAGKRLANQRLTVVDATNVQPEARKKLLALAKEHDTLAAAIVFDLPERLCARRNAARADRNFGPHVLRRQRDQLRRGLRGLRREGFRTVHVLGSAEEVEAARIVRTPLYSDRRGETGPFDVIGDVHGCRAELEALLVELGYRIGRDEAGRANGAHHPQRRVIFLGDLVDRGPDTAGVLRLAMGMVEAGDALAVVGNHEHKLLRALRGARVRVSHGLAESLEQLAAEPEEFRGQVERFLDSLTSHYVLDGGRLAVAHAGVPARYQGRASGRVRAFCMYGDTTGETDEFGLPVRYPWAIDYRGRAMVLYGHTPVPELEWVNNTLCLDTGCVFGGRLTALRYPERELVSVPAARVYYASPKPFPAGPDAAGPDAAGTAATGTAAPGADSADVAAAAERASGRDPLLLEVTDVLTRRVVETAQHGRVGIREENAAAALEVLSRFALAPQWLRYLPPTMSPVATATGDGLLEHPRQAFEAFRADGIDAVVCQEKHMGSRAVVVLPRDAEAARRHFGATAGVSGAIHTRTGRSFFDPAATELLLERLRRAAERAGLFERLSASWLLLDTELLPWSAKAQTLITGQYAAVGAAARAVLPVAVAALERAHRAGRDTGALLERSRRRLEHADGFTAAYRSYCWPTDGVTGVQVAPFQLLATDTATYHGQPHSWHLELADQLAEVDPELVRRTRWLAVDTTDEERIAAATRWWEELTAAGGEGMVVKPAANLTRGGRGLVQPGLKVRGREYLRIIYGPDYTEPANLERLRQRHLGHKRALALREYALGLEALERGVRGEPLWRIHECVAAVLALESEPVDPRL